MASAKLLKRDMLGTISVLEGPDGLRIRRDTRTAATGLGWLARLLARREAHALGRLSGIDGVPALIDSTGRMVTRDYLPGEPMHRATPPGAEYFTRARRLLRRIHRAGVAHNDLAKEANWLCIPDQRCAIVDFQLAAFSSRRGPLFRLLAREDLRHLLKHKRRYAPAALTARERAILSSPSWPARALRICFKPVYHFATRRLLGWPEREGAEER